jgi:acyl-CoA reductase-like NAD-dependent aldehyde dehydrogenase
MVQFAEQMDQTSIIQDVIQRQRQFFTSGATQPLRFRLAQLRQLRQVIVQHQDAVLQALQADLGKPNFEAYAAEIGVLREVDHALKHLKTWMKPRRSTTTIDQFPARAWVVPEPLGVALIISPWNYPFQLMISPMVGAIAAGNCAILKPSELAPHISAVMATLIRDNFDPDYLTVIEGGVDTSKALLAEPFDHIFFTGGTAIGKVVMKAAAEHLTPVTLELGGKSPCIVEPDIQLEYAAKRIVWGKFLNAGQTCIAPDYLLVNRAIKSDLLAAIQTTIQAFYGDDPGASPDYARIVSDRHFHRLTALIPNSGTLVVGGESRASDRYIAPTVLDNVPPDAPVMQDEIFGPILPVLEYDQVEEAIAFIKARPKPLALYLFSKNPAIQRQVLAHTSSGGVCINDTILQVGAPDLPFGGVGPSGMGSYHGKASFDTFSHYKSVLHRSFWMDVDVRYPPYTNKLNLLKKIIK